MFKKTFNKWTCVHWDCTNKPMYFCSHVSITTRDNGFKIYKEKSKSKIRANFFGNRVANIWNTLRASVVQAPNINCFKSRLDKLWEPHRYIEDMRTIPRRTNSAVSLKFGDE